jgi:hypothetical protein
VTWCEVLRVGLMEFVFVVGEVCSGVWAFGEEWLNVTGECGDDLALAFWAWSPYFHISHPLLLFYPFLDF